jgi:hypothetical protein
MTTRRPYSSRLAERNRLRERYPATPYFVIEHPTKGMFKELDYDVVTHKPVPRFSTSANRGDDVVQKFFHTRQVRDILARFPEKIRERCECREAPEFNVVDLSFERRAGEPMLKIVRWRKPLAEKR